MTASICFWLWLYPVGLANGPTTNFLEASNAPKSILRAGAAALSAGDYAGAYDQFTQAIEQFPGAALSNRCLVNIKLEQYAAAEQDCLQALSVRADEPEALLNLGLARYHLGHYEQAIASYQQLIQLNPTDYRAQYNLGAAEAALGQHEMAIAYYTQALAATPEQPNAIIYRDRGVSYLLTADYDSAVNDLNTAVELAPTDLWARFDRGCAYHRSKNFILALQDFDWVLAQDAQMAKAYFNEGVVHAQMGHMQVAISNLRQAAKFFKSEGNVVQVERSQQLIEKLKTKQSTPVKQLRPIRILLGTIANPFF